MKKYLLEAVVFTTGLGIMVFEIVGARVLAPYVGTSTRVWSVLIGTILAALSLGYWWGGRIADRKADYKYLSLIVFLAGIFVALTALFRIPIIDFFDGHIANFVADAFWLSLILFAPGSFFMAAVSPYAIRLRIDNLKQSGAVAGNLYSVSTFGSIVGAFLTGLVLIPRIGSTKILYSLSILLILVSIIAFSQRNLKAKTAAIIATILLAMFSSKIDFHFLPLKFIQTEYQDIALVNGVDSYSDLDNGNPTGRPVLQVYTGPNTVQSAMFTDNDNEMVLPYTEILSVLGKYFVPKINNALVIGGGAYSIPKDIIRKQSDAHVDVVEIDPGMIKIAEDFFNAKQYPGITSYSEDGRTYLNHNQKKYDAIYLDSFKTYITPFQLTTLETAKRVYDSLTDNGVVFLNVIQSIEGDSGRFFRAEYKTYKQVFPELYVFRVEEEDPTAVQNIILVATKSSDVNPLESSDPRTSAYLEHVYVSPIQDDARLITDDYAPVSDYMVAASRVIKSQRLNH